MLRVGLAARAELPAELGALPGEAPAVVLRVAAEWAAARAEFRAGLVELPAELGALAAAEPDVVPRVAGVQHAAAPVELGA